MSKKLQRPIQVSTYATERKSYWAENDVNCDEPDASARLCNPHPELLVNFPNGLIERNGLIGQRYSGVIRTDFLELLQFLKNPLPFGDGHDD